MSTLSLISRAVLAAGLSAGVATAAHADPLPSALRGSADSALTANYHLDFPAPGVQAGDPISLGESDLKAPEAAVTRRIDWGDGSPVETRTAADPEHGWSHTYTKGGDFHVSVQLTSGTSTGTGAFPDGDTVTVFASAPPELLSGTFRLAPDHVRVDQPVQLSESDIHGDDAPPVYVFRYVNWGDGSKQDEYSGHLPPPAHKYAKPGTYHVSVHMVNLQWHTAGTFPDGNTVAVTGGTGTGGTGSGGNAGTGGGGGNAGGAGGGTGGGGLPITGPDVAVLGGGGLVLVLGGATAFVLLRRRRTRFVS